MITWNDLSQFEREVIEALATGDKYKRSHNAVEFSLHIQGLINISEWGKYAGVQLLLTDKGRALYAARHAPEQAAPDGLTKTQQATIACLAQGGTWERRNLPHIDPAEMTALIQRGIVEHKGYNGSCEYFALAAQPEAAPVAIDMTPDMLAALAEYVRQTAYAVEYEMTPYWRELDIVRQWDGDWLIVSPDFVAATDTDAYDLFRLVHVSAVKRVLTRERYWRTLTFEDRNVLDMYPEIES